jgi:AcrR family transcriptional regulator
VKQSTLANKARLPKELRDERRRDEIVAAARECVVRRGFHAASMAEIAAAARMSVGQIYRYFVNKEAIVHAIVERIVANRLRMLSDTTGRPDEAEQIVEHLATGTSAEVRDDDILMLEVTAESTRNPAVAEIVKRADERLRALALATFKRSHPNLPPQTVAARVELLAVMIEGTLLRRLTVRAVETTNLRDVYLEIIERLVSQEE